MLMKTFHKMICNYEIGKKSLIGIVSIFIFLLLFTIFSTSLFLTIQGIDKANANTLIVSRTFFWIFLLIIWLYATKIEKYKLFIWKDRKYDFLNYCVHIILLFIAIIVVMIPVGLILQYFGSKQISSKLVEIKSILQDSKTLVLFVVITAGFTEEIIFRGYIQPRLEALLKNPYISIFITSAMFGLLHFGYGTIGNMTGPFFIGLIFSIYYWKYRNIKVLIICHTLIDLIALSTIFSHS